MLFEVSALKRDFTELRCFDMVLIAKAARYYMVHTLKLRYSEFSISQQESELILHHETLNKTRCICRRGLKLEITHRKFSLFDGSTIPHKAYHFPSDEKRQSQMVIMEAINNDGFFTIISRCLKMDNG